MIHQEIRLEFDTGLKESRRYCMQSIYCHQNIMSLLAWRRVCEFMVNEIIKHFWRFESAEKEIRKLNLQSVRES